MNNDKNALGDLQWHGVLILVLLTLQFALGMAINLFVAFPSSGSPGDYWVFAWSQGAFAAHVVVGILIFLLLLFLLVRSVLLEKWSWTVASTLGLCGMAMAIAGGVEFVPSQTGSFSYLMTFGFIASFWSMTAHFVYVAHSKLQ